MRIWSKRSSPTPPTPPAVRAASSPPPGRCCNLRLPDGSRLAAWVGPVDPARIDDPPPSPCRRHPHRPTTPRHCRRRLGRVSGGGGASPQKHCGDRRIERRQNHAAAGVGRRVRPATKRLSCWRRKPNWAWTGSRTGTAGWWRWRPGRRTRKAPVKSALAVLMTHALRMNARRILVGEVRGDELIPMLTAMGSGNPGSLCTLHANTSAAAISRMVAIGLTVSASATGGGDPCADRRRRRLRRPPRPRRPGYSPPDGGLSRRFGKSANSVKAAGSPPTKSSPPDLMAGPARRWTRGVCRT